MNRPALSRRSHSSGRFVRSLLQHDLKLVRRDRFLVGVPLYPLLGVLALLYGLPHAERFLLETWGFGLEPYRPLLESLFLLLFPPFMSGLVMGFLLLDERDEHTLSALLVTPLPLTLFVAYRAGVTVVLSTLLSLLGFAMMGVAFTGSERLALALAAALFAPTITLLFAGFAENKIQGFGFMKILNALTLLPFVGYFLPPLYAGLIRLVMPIYWPLAAYWAGAGGVNVWLYSGLGILFGSLLYLLLLVPLRRRAYRG